jgi:hypothetical protein
VREAVSDEPQLALQKTKREEESGAEDLGRWAE